MDVDRNVRTKPSPHGVVSRMARHKRFLEYGYQPYGENSTSKPEPITIVVRGCSYLPGVKLFGGGVFLVEYQKTFFDSIGTPLGRKNALSLEGGLELEGLDGSCPLPLLFLLTETSCKS